MHGGRKSPFVHLFSSYLGAGLRTKTEINGFQGSRTQTGPAAGAGQLRLPGTGFAYENRNQWVSWESYANRGAWRAGNFHFLGTGFAYENRNHGVSEETYANRGA